MSDRRASIAKGNARVRLNPVRGDALLATGASQWEIVSLMPHKPPNGGDRLRAQEHYHAGRLLQSALPPRLQHKRAAAFDLFGDEACACRTTSVASCGAKRANCSKLMLWPITRTCLCGCIPREPLRICFGASKAIRRSGRIKRFDAGQYSPGSRGMPPSRSASRRCHGSWLISGTRRAPSETRLPPRTCLALAAKRESVAPVRGL
jgi:hypothetical protein